MKRGSCSFIRMRYFVLLLALLNVPFAQELAVTNHTDEEIEPITYDQSLHSASFYTFETVRKQLVEWATTNSKIAKLDTIGKSQGGKPIWILRIASAPSTTPRQRYYINGAAHGNEYIGTEIVMRIAKELISKYDADEKIKQIVDRSEFVLEPILNADGFVKKRRTLDNGKDPNRCFGFMVGEKGESLPYEFPEVKTYRDIMIEAPHMLSIDYHCGMESLLKAYFGGITLEWDKGGYEAIAKLYPIPGSTQRAGISCDGSAGTCGSIGLLPEVSPHNPPLSNLEKIASHNYACVMKCIDEMQKGVCGVVTDIKTNRPLSGRVSVKGLYAPIPTQSQSGAYFKYISNPSGNLDVSVFANGYKTQTQSIAADPAKMVKLDFKMEPQSTQKYGAITILALRCDNKMTQTELYSCLELNDGKSMTLQATSQTASVHLDFGASPLITDKEGNDLTVFATGKYVVNAALDVNKLEDASSKLGDGDGKMSFDLKKAGISKARFIKISIASGSMTIDAVEAEPGDMTQLSPSYPVSVNGLRIIDVHSQKGAINRVALNAYVPKGEYCVEIFDLKGKEVSVPLYGNAMVSGEISRSIPLNSNGTGFNTLIMSITTDKKRCSMKFIYGL